MIRKRTQDTRKGPRKEVDVEKMKIDSKDSKV